MIAREEYIWSGGSPFASRFNCRRDKECTQKERKRERETEREREKIRDAKRTDLPFVFLLELLR